MLDFLKINDPWKYLAFPASAIIAFFSVQVLLDDFSKMTGLNEFSSKIALLAGIGLVIGFLVDEMVPAYIDKVRGSSGGGSDFGGDSGGDDFGGGEDFGGDAGGGGGDDFDF